MFLRLAPANAETADRPTVWIELGGQMEAMQGTSSPFTSPFMTAISPTPGPYANDIFLRGQQPPHLAFGLEGAATFQPEVRTGYSPPVCAMAGPKPIAMFISKARR